MKTKEQKREEAIKANELLKICPKNKLNLKNNLEN